MISRVRCDDKKCGKGNKETEKKDFTLFNLLFTQDKEELKRKWDLLKIRNSHVPRKQLVRVWE